MTPHLLIELTLQSFAAEDILEELGKYYLDSVASGRVDVWARAAHSWIDLLADDSRIPRARRDDLFSNDSVEGPGAASSRTVPSHDGLAGD